MSRGKIASCYSWGKDRELPFPGSQAFLRLMFVADFRCRVNHPVNGSMNLVITVAGCVIRIAVQEKREGERERMGNEFGRGDPKDKAKGGQQDIVLSARENLRVTGVKDVIAFDETCILLETALGRLHVKGEGLKVKSLDEKAGELFLEGKIDSLAYTGAGKQGGSMLRRLFQ